MLKNFVSTQSTKDSMLPKKRKHICLEQIDYAQSHKKIQKINIDTVNYYNNVHANDDDDDEDSDIEFLDPKQKANRKSANMIVPLHFGSRLPNVPDSFPRHEYFKLINKIQQPDVEIENNNNANNYNDNICGNMVDDFSQHNATNNGNNNNNNNNDNICGKSTIF